MCYYFNIVIHLLVYFRDISNLSQDTQHLDLFYDTYECLMFSCTTIAELLSFVFLCVFF